MQTASAVEWYDRHRAYNIWFNQRRKYSRSSFCCFHLW